MRLLRALTLAAGLAATSFGATALQPDKAFHHQVRGSWSIQDGLPQISALAITQDRDGYIWVGTQAGLARFDGVRFAIFMPENEPALPGIYVRALLAGRDGRVWIGTYKGLAVHDSTGFHTVPLAGRADAGSLDIGALAQDAAGTVWVGAAEGLFRLRDGRLEAVAGAPAPVTALLAARDGLYVGSRGSISRLADGRWTHAALPGDAATAAVNRLVADDGQVWAATAYGLFVREAGHWRAYDEVPQLQATPLELLYPDRDGNLWVGGDAGLARLRDGHLAEFVAAKAPGGIEGLRVAFEDREGSLWLGSQWNGLTRVWDSWTRRYSRAEGLNEPIVWSVAPDPDGQRIWVGTNQGLSVLDGGRYRLVVPPAALPHPQAYNLLAEDGRIWVGTRRGLVIAHEDGRVERPAWLAPLASLQINGIVPDAGGYWIPTSGGLFRLDGQRLRHYGAEAGLADLQVRYVHRGRDGALLVGSQGGLFELRGERFVAVGRDRGLPADLDVVSVTTLDGGRRVLGVLSEKLYYFDGARWLALGEAQGMPRNAPFFLTEHDGYLWAPGLRGIARVPLADLRDFAAGRIARVRGEMLLNERGDAKSGQQGYCCNGAGNAKGFLRGHALWLPSRDGVVAMDTTAIVKNTVAPRAVIERVQIDEHWQPARVVAGDELPPDARDLSFEFTVPSFQDPKSTGVQYRLRGYDRQWRTADPLNRSARYTNLPPGDYTFEVRGSNNAGIATRAPARLAFGIRPRFHETAWFAALLALALAALVYAGYRFQQHRHRRQREALERLVAQRTADLAEATRRAEEASLTDPLTGLRNRRYIGNQMPADLAYYDRQMTADPHEGEMMLFALVDIDHFKSVNDRHGHKAGDLVLQQFAGLLRTLVRTGDYVARWGGEEFLLVFRPMASRNLITIGERVRAMVAAHAFDIGDGRTLAVTCSVGLAEYPLFRDHGASLGWEQMVELADQALYWVKGHGRDGWAAFRPTSGTRMDSVLADVKRDPQAMLETGQLTLAGRVAGELVGLDGEEPRDG